MVSKEVGLPRPRVEGLLREGVRWRVTYCWGAHRPDDSESGLGSLPQAGRERVPNQSAARKIARGRASKTYFFAQVIEDEDGPLLLLNEP